MRNLKRVLSLALAVVMVIGMMVMTTGAADFTDADEITYSEAVAVMSGLKVLEGYNGTFNPNGVLYRDAAAKIICFMLMGPDKAVALEGAGTGMFADTKGLWSEGYVEYCANLGIVNGWNGNFAPASELTCAAFGKMLLCALGYDAETEGYNGDNWISCVFNQLVELGLDLKGVSAEAKLTREQAAEMAFRALQCTMVYYDGGMNVTTADGTTVSVGATRYNKGEGNFDSGDANNTMQFFERYFEDLEKKTAPGYDADLFGRPGYTWVVDENDSEKDVFIVEEPIATYTKSMADIAGKGAKEIQATLKGYSLTNVDIITDGLAAGAATIAVADIVNVTSDNAVVEIYVDKQNKTVDEIVVINTYAATVGTVTEADEENDTPASITLAGATNLNTIETDKFAAEDVVLYTKVWDGVDAYDVVTIEEADSFTGTLTAYTADNKFTIDGEVYERSGIALDNDATIINNIGLKKVYHLDANGEIIKVTAVPGTAPVVIKDYAVVLDAKGEVKSSTAKWPATGSTTTVTAKIQVLLSDGTVEVWDVPVYKAAKAIDGTSIGEGDFYYYLASTIPTKVTITGSTSGTNTTDSGTLTTALKVAGVYTHADKALVASVGNLLGTETQNGTKLFANGTDPITKASYTNTHSGNTVILNDQTVFVLAKEAGDISKGFVVKTGLAALEDTSITATKAQVVTAVTAGKDPTTGLADSNYNVNVATVVFVDKTIAFDGADATATDDMVYVNGSYVVTLDTDGANVYTYSVVYADGTTGTISTETEDLDTAIYKLKTDGTVDTATKNATKLTVKVVSGTTVVLADGTGMTTTAKTVYVPVVDGGTLKAGAEMYVVQTSNVISLAFIVK